MNYDTYGHRHRGLRAGRVRDERHFSGSKAPDPPPVSAAPVDKDAEAAKREQRSKLERRRGRRATQITPSDQSYLGEPATQRGALTPGVVSRLGG